MKRYKKVIHISSFSNFKISIFLIGYKNIGESIVVLFKDCLTDPARVFFSFVVDSYKNANIFVTKKILEDNHVTSLDMVYWTHPHKDHTPGIDTIVETFFKSEMVFFQPKYYFGNIQKDLLKDESEFTEDANSVLDEFLKSKDKDYANRRTVIGEGDMTHNYPIKMLAADGTSKELIFFFLTPIGRFIDKYSIRGNEISRPNDLSISFVMSVDGYDFYFGGDAEKDHVNNIEKESIRGMRWIKVPHHCSKGGRFICDNLGPRFDFAASTVYSSSGLPSDEIQNLYAAKGHLFMTQLKNEENVRDYGVVEFDYCFRDEDILVNIHTYGNAGEYAYMDNSLVSGQE